MKSRGQDLPCNVIAVRSGWLVGGTFILAAVMSGCLAWAIFEIVVVRVQTYLIAGYAILLLVIFGVLAYYICCAIAIPRIIAEYDNGKIIFYPSIRKSYTVKVEDIVFISQKNYHNSYKTLGTGTLKIHTAQGEIKLRWVKEVDEVRRRIEMLK